MLVFHRSNRVSAIKRMFSCCRHISIFVHVLSCICVFLVTVIYALRVGVKALYNAIK